MQSVTPKYKESMASIGRNRGYIKVTIGIVNSEAQENIKLSDETKTTYFSNSNFFNDFRKQKTYATCEENFSSIDGTMYFAPKKDSKSEIYNNGIVVSEFLGKAVFTFETEEVYDIVGFTIDFGENYPTDFELVSGEDTILFSENNSRYFTTDLGFHNVRSLEIVPKKMKASDNSRLRIYSLTMGIANVFTNDNTVSFSQDDYVSPISDSIPSKDVEIVVTNYDQHFNPDNENSAMAYFEEGQEVRTQFGYDTNDDGNIEWLPESISHLKEWSATDKDATFKSTDIFDYMSGTYYKGLYRVNGISAYDLAIDVLKDAEISKYRLDAYLKNVMIYNPIPVVSHTEALQIIANACRSALYEDRDGTIVIESDFVPTYEIDCNSQARFSNVKNIGNDKPKIAYAMASNGFCLLEDTQLKFISDNIENIGYVSDSISNSEGNFEVNPVLKITMESSYSPSNFYITFRNNAPKEFVIKTFSNNASVDVIEIRNPEISFAYNKQLNAFDYMEIEFTKGKGNDRITVDKVLFGAPTDYEISRNMMLDSPKVDKDAKIKAFSIIKTIFTETTETKESTTKLTGIKNGEYAVYFSNPSYSYSITKNSGTGSVSIKESSCYRVVVTVSGNTDGNIEFSIKYKEYNVDNNSKYIVEHNANGIEKTWENPLISTDEQASKLEKWLADYLLLGINYEFSWRGDPRTDANDLFYMELKSNELVNIRAFQSKISFNGAWSGEMKARKVVI